MAVTAASCCLHRIGRTRLWVALLVAAVVIAALIITSGSLPASSDGTAQSEDASGESSVREVMSDVDAAVDLLNSDRTDLRYHLNDMRRLQTSVMAELRRLEQQRTELKAAVERYQDQLTAKQREAAAFSADTLSARMALDELRAQLREQQEIRGFPFLRLPAPLYVAAGGNGGGHYGEGKVAIHRSPLCRLHTCFDYSRCSLTAAFSVYVYEEPVAVGNLTVAQSTAASWLGALRSSDYATTDGETACMYAVVVVADDQSNESNSTLEKNLRSLAHWNGDGRNHVLLFVSRGGLSAGAAGIDAQLAMRAGPYFMANDFRPNFDIVAFAAPPCHRLTLAVEELPLALPARRQNLLTFDGQPPDSYLKQLLRISASDHDAEARFLEDLWQLAKEDGVNFDLGCTNVELVPVGDDFSDSFPMTGESEWTLCGSFESRRQRLVLSTFVLITPPANSSLVATPAVLGRLIEALHAGTVPVVLGDHALLPFGGDGSPLSWREACLVVPRARVVELPYILAAVSDSDIIAMRLRGRELLERHLGSARAITATLLGILRVRLGLPAQPARDELSHGAFSHGAVPRLTYTPRVDAPDELLGLVEPPFASASFVRNFSIISSAVHFFTMFPSTPWDPLLPTDAKFHGSSYGFRPINGGQGGAGMEFSMALGGNSPKEQFTIIILTYDRIELMISQLESYKSLPNLNKVVVVWNNPVLPGSDLKWPDIGVPVHVLKMGRNSLNNRFLPFDIIETEAVLSVDDDVFLRLDEITFAFRVWRENRERLVGFPGRYHAWDAKHGNWLYNSNHSCELSLVLTGAAFFHKYYMHIYSNVMQPAIRAKVDEFMNCEDLAMNFLIAHITRKPPIKVTSRWTFLCPSCGDSALWTDKSHFHERHECINFFTRVYGYTPLLYTQYRADSVLFKTKVPSDKTKCFKYV